MTVFRQFFQVFFFASCGLLVSFGGAAEEEKSRTLIRARPTQESSMPSSPPQAATIPSTNKFALLVGVGKYKDHAPSQLAGPPHDVDALRQALIAHWSFSPTNITTLVDSQATKKNILQEIEKLLQRSQANDEIFIYYSGHGTSPLDEGFGGQINLPHHSGAILPFDFSSSDLAKSLIIGKTDLRPLLTQFDQSSKRVLVAFDSCYSGNSVRSLFIGNNPKTQARYVKLPSASAKPAAVGTKAMAAIEPYPYRNVLYLSAAQENETATDDSVGARTLDGRPHGAFTDALLRILNNQSRADLNGDGLISFQEMYEAAKTIVAEQHWPQTPMALPLNGGNSAMAGVAGLPLFQANAGAGTTAAPIQQPVLLKISVLALGESEKSALAAVAGVRIDDQNPDLIFKKQTDGRIEVISGAGDRIIDDLPGKLPQQMAVWLEGRVGLAKLLNLAKSKAGFTASLEMGNGLGGTAVIEGDRFNFSLQTERPAYLLLLSVNAQNQINILYPYNPQELAERSAGQPISFPGSLPQDLIEATGPFGIDQVLMLAFDAGNQRPQVLDRLVGLEQLSLESPPIQELVRMLDSGREHYGASTLSLVSVSRLEANRILRQ